MKTKEEITKRLKEVSKQRFTYHDKNNTIQLEGTYSSDELNAITGVLYDVEECNRQIKNIKALKIGEFTSNDVKVVCHILDNCYSYSFYLMKDGKDWDFYYGKDQGAGDWWPRFEDFFTFVPSGFAEECENIYSYRGEYEKVKELLKECGFTIEEIRESV